jgi:tetratricopeptide (TPR) repeat protein
MEVPMHRFSARSVLGAIAIACLVAGSAVPALAGICFTSGKVYIQQKVWNKAAEQLECARKEEPENIQVYLLLASARAELKQYAAAGAAFSKGIELAQKKKDDKKVKELENNRMAYLSRLYNAGVKAMSSAMTAQGIPTDANRTMNEAGTPQEKVEKERGAPKDFGRFTEGGQSHEFWYYPDAGVAYHFSPGMSEPRQFPFKPFATAPAPDAAITDTTTFNQFEGASRVEEATYNFTLATLIDPTTADAYKNLSYLYEVLGRTDDAMAAARKGLAIKPDDAQLARNLRVAAMGRANRLFAAKAYREAIPAYRIAVQNDPAGKVIYLSTIADSWYRLADGMPKTDASRAATFDSAAAAYRVLLAEVPADSTAIRVNAYYNTGVIYANLEQYKKAAEVLDEAVKAFPTNKDLLSLGGQTKFQAGDTDGAVEMLRKALEVDPKDPVVHEFLFHSYTKDPKKYKDQGVAEYSIYKALTDGKPRTGAELKVWVDSADNRLGPNHQLKKTITAEGYPEEVRTFRDGDKQLESWFYWSKGKVITFMEGQLLSKASLPPSKS